jgi:hypothetical protein
MRRLGRIMGIVTIICTSVFNKFYLSNEYVIFYNILIEKEQLIINEEEKRKASRNFK